MAVGGEAKLFVEPQGGVVEVVDAELDLGEAAVAGPAVSLGHEAGGDATALMGLGDDELLDHGVAAGRERGDIGHFKALQGLDAHESDDGAIDLGEEERLIRVGQVSLEQAPRAGGLVGWPETVGTLAGVEGVGFGVQAAGGGVVGGFGKADVAVHGR